MKFSHKLALAMLALLAVVLNAGAAWLVRSSFDSQLETAQRQNEAHRQRDAYGVKMALIEAGAGPYDTDLLKEYGQRLQSYGGTGGEWMALYNGSGFPVWSSLPEAVTATDQRAALTAGDTAVTYLDTDDGVFQLYATKVEQAAGSAWVLNAYDVTGLFEARDALLWGFARVEGAAFAALVVLVLAMSRMLTRPVARLEEAARRIAAGAYDERTALKGEDELADLSRSFDRMAQAVQQKVEQLDLSVRQRDDFVAAFTHELKTPITSMMGYASLLRAGELPPEQRKKAADYIYHETKRLEALSRKLMVFMELEHTGTLELEPLELKTLEARLRRIRPPQAKTELVFEGFEGLAVLAQPDLILALVQNLVSNAGRADPADGKVTLTAEAKEGRVTLAVKDKGRGIPAEELARVTEPFYMVDRSRARAQNGSGFGLALCARIAKLHGGELAIESEVGKGTTVRFDLKEAGR